VTFTKLDKIGVAERVAEQIRDAILHGSFLPGDVLPGERVLAQSFGVNRSSVREAMHRLDALGMIETRHGEKSRVADFLTSAGLFVLPLLLTKRGRIDCDLMADVLTVRVAVLGATAKAAARKRTGDDVKKLARALEMLEQATSAEERLLLDWQFFELLVVASANQVMAALAHWIRRFYLGNQTQFLMLYGAPFACDALNDVVCAIDGANENDAKAAMERYAEQTCARFGASP
jgi:GntR family transcriptional regulator, transcriptional repressor for pyruvate dehydrogenase complex